METTHYYTSDMMPLQKGGYLGHVDVNIIPHGQLHVVCKVEDQIEDLEQWDLTGSREGKCVRN